MSFAELKALEADVLKLERDYQRSSDAVERHRFASEILERARRLASLEKRAIISNRVKSDDLIERYTREREATTFQRLEQIVEPFFQEPFRPDAYADKKQRMHRAFEELIAARAAEPGETRVRDLIMRLWERMLREDDEWETHEKLARGR